ncbi:hypothetical protein GCM10027614_45780 [Micromonospora vulcania]
MHQGADRLADRVAADAQRGDELWLGGDAPADRPLAAQDPGPELLDRLPNAVTRGGSGGTGPELTDGGIGYNTRPEFIP